VPRHDLDAISLVAGVAFAGLAAVVLLDQGAVLGARWLFPLLLIAMGVAGLAANLSRSRD